jgi:hypothetical protein
MYVLIDEEKARQTDRQTDREIDREIDGLTYAQTSIDK